MFREAIERKDMGAVDEMLADDVVFISPVAFAPYAGKAITSAILHTVVEVLEDFSYVRQLRDGHHEAYVFTAKVNGLEITGCDFLTLDEQGRISEFMVMTRPLKASQALAAAMGERFPQITAAAEARTAG
ncbi:nuclear transport factor 2 family protein [Janibacter sp. GS2]|uniref:nuclear transport factor 2 family protein n=1 Tax=Janibacter sp. GS2 TaxID=3442646 RepID=UPI003EBBDE8E